jgi:hypothetical protein
MPRSPYQGTFLPNVRPTVVTAPDAIVYINGEQEVIGCPQCSRTFNLNKYITAIQTDLSVDSVPGSASITLAIPRHSIDDFYFDGNAVVTPMMEVEIYSKGFYLVEGIPQYYPIFWGIITEVTDDYSGGEHTVNIHCADILKWWELCKMNINPAYSVTPGQQGRSIVGNVFAQTNPYDMIFTLALQSFGDVIVGTGSLNNKVQESGQRATFDAALSDMMAYWEKRFARMRSNLLLYGTSGFAVRGSTLYRQYSKENPPGTVPKKSYAAQVIAEGNNRFGGSQMVFAPESPNVAAFRTVISNAGQIDLWQSEFQTKLELANAAKEAVGFEFYMDVTGDIVFKPPFYNLDVLGNKPMSWIQDIDIIDWGFSESEAEVVTQIVMQGSFGGTIDYGTPADITPYTSVTDYHLLRKYGWRQQNYNSEFLSSPQLMFYQGLDVLDRINSKRHRGSVTIPMRPELRLGFPIYIAPKDQIWYVSGISHSISFGSRATTSLTLTSKRSKFIAPKGIGDIKLKSFNGQPEATTDGMPRSFRFSSRQLSKNGVFELKVGDAASIPPSDAAFTAQAGANNPYDPLILRHPKTGRIVGYPNVVMAYTRPFAPADISEQAGQKKTASPYSPKSAQAAQEKNLQAVAVSVQSRLKANDEDSLVDRLTTNRYQYGLNSAGVFIYARDSSNGGGVISEILTLPSKNVQVIPKDSSLDHLRGQTAMIRPVSDERGFEVIGHFQYGRRLFLKDGRLITNAVGSKRVQVDLPLALSGGMSEMLTAQSQGLSTISTGYQDPAKTLATMTPEDNQTAAIITPGTTDPQFVDVGDNFISSNTLESQGQQGSPASVEATQLSRALTLAEMSVKDSQTRNDEDCVCLTGRSDLAFINSGYQVKTLTGNGATPDISVLTTLEAAGGPINSGATQAAASAATAAQQQLAFTQQQLAVLQSAADQDPGDKPEQQAKQQAVLDQMLVVEAALTKSRAADLALDDLRMQHHTSESVFTQSGTELIGKVDLFLVNLYSALDTPHQQFEHAIRGDLLPGQAQDTSDLNGPQVNPPSEFAPPFSAANRFRLGDPTAAVGAVQTNVANITKSWSDFGKNLKANTEKASLSKQISQDQASITRLTATRQQLVQQQQSSAVVIGVNLQKSIASIDKEIARLTQDIANNQTKLRT